MRVVRQEIEVKLRVGDAAAMRRRLRRMGARVVRRVHEMNTLFDTPQGTLRKQGRLMRLREETAQMGKRETRYVLTFKGPVKQASERQNAPAPSASLGTSRRRRRARYKVREEAEYMVGDARALWAVAGQGGMRPSFRYEKFRTSYRVHGAGGVHVEFDETPAGVFLELEGSRRAIDRMARQLGYGPRDYIVRSYAALHFEECRRRGVRAGDMVFDKRRMQPAKRAG